MPPTVLVAFASTECNVARYQTITNIDISRVVVDQMIEKYKDKSALTYQQMNVCSLEFPDESFDAVVVKGTMDAILCGEGSTANVAKMCQEVSRVLKVWPSNLTAWPPRVRSRTLSRPTVSFSLCHMASQTIDYSTLRSKTTPGP